MSETHCIFCKIVQKQAQADILYQDELVTAFQDAHPITPVHILVVPNRHIQSANQLTPEDEQLVGHMVVTASRLAQEYQVEKSGYRLVINTGPMPDNPFFIFTST